MDYISDLFQNETLSLSDVLANFTHYEALLTERNGSGPNDLANWDTHYQVHLALGKAEIELLEDNLEAVSALYNLLHSNYKYYLASPRMINTGRWWASYALQISA